MTQPRDPGSDRALAAARANALEAHTFASAPLTAVLRYLTVLVSEAESLEQLGRTKAIALHVAEAAALLESLADILAALDVERQSAGG